MTYHVMLKGTILHVSPPVNVTVVVEKVEEVYHNGSKQNKYTAKGSGSYSTTEVIFYSEDIERNRESNGAIYLELKRKR